MEIRPRRDYSAYVFVCTLMEIQEGHNKCNLHDKDESSMWKVYRLGLPETIFALSCTMFCFKTSHFLQGIISALLEAVWVKNICHQIWSCFPLTPWVLSTVLLPYPAFFFCERSQVSRNLLFLQNKRFSWLWSSTGSKWIFLQDLKVMHWDN